MLEGRLVAAIRQMASRGYGIRAIARELGVGRKAVRHYLRQPVPAGFQVRPSARCLTDRWRQEARQRFRTDGDATVVHRWFAQQGMPVSVWTIRRAVLDLRRHLSRPRDDRSSGEPSTVDSRAPISNFDWEFQLIRRIANRFGAGDPTELESTLVEHLATLLPPQPHVRNWKAYVRTALRRRALNWNRDRKQERLREMSLDRPLSTDDEAITVHDRLPGVEASPLTREILKRIRRELDPPLRQVCDAMIQENMNRTRAAKRLGIHRNTLGQRLRTIHERFKNREF